MYLYTLNHLSKFLNITIVYSKNTCTKMLRVLTLLEVPNTLSNSYHVYNMCSHPINIGCKPQVNKRTTHSMFFLATTDFFPKFFTKFNKEPKDL